MSAHDSNNVRRRETTAGLSVLHEAAHHCRCALSLCLTAGCDGIARARSGTGRCARVVAMTAGWKRKRAGASCFPLRGLPVSEGSSARPARHTPAFQGCQHAFHIAAFFPTLIQKLHDWNLLPRPGTGVRGLAVKTEGRDTWLAAQGGDEHTF